MTRKSKRLCENLTKGAVAGLAGGLAGTLAMAQFQNLWNKMSGSRDSPHEDPANIKAAVSLLHVPENRKEAAGNLVDYSFGTLSGAAYGAAAEVSPAVRAGVGTLFGATLFVVVDEMAVPALGWSRPPSQYPWTSHLYGLVSHLVYGVTTDGVRRAVRSAIS